MGLPVERLVVATNSNDIMERALNSGVYFAGAAHATLSPSMDVQIASNFERALFEASGRNASWVAGAMRKFSESKRLAIRPDALKLLRERYAAGSASDDETLAAIAATYSEFGVVVDPHTAVGLAVARKLEFGDAPKIVLSTAHPAKFPDAVARAIGVAPALPARLQGLLALPENYTVLPNSVDAVREFVGERAMAA
jgi:threonine synthase